MTKLVEQSPEKSAAKCERSPNFFDPERPDVKSRTNKFSIELGHLTLSEKRKRYNSFSQRPDGAYNDFAQHETHGEELPVGTIYRQNEPIQDVQI